MVMDGSVVVRGRGFHSGSAAAARGGGGDRGRYDEASTDQFRYPTSERQAEAGAGAGLAGGAGAGGSGLGGMGEGCGGGLAGYVWQARVAVSVCRAEARGELFIVCRARVPCDGWAVEVQNAAEEPGGRCICGCDGGGDGGGGSVGRLWRWWWRTVWR